MLPRDIIHNPQEAWSSDCKLLAFLSMRSMCYPFASPVLPVSRPILSPSGTSPLPMCGSVFHHVLIYVKQGEEVSRLDFGPADGTDVTANIMYV